MKKSNLSPVLAATMAATVCINADQAVAEIVTYTNATLISISGNGPHTIPISEIQNADALLGISAGTVGGYEGGTFTLAVQYDNSSTQTIYTNSWPWGPGQTVGLNAMPSQPFLPGDIVALIFNLNGELDSSQLTIPAGTIFSFDVTAIPEPTSAALLVFGSVGLWASTRRKTS